MHSKKKSGKEIIDEGDWANCKISETIFKRKRLTKRYCFHCHSGFCEGEHGTFEGKKFAVCINCYN